MAAKKYVGFAMSDVRSTGWVVAALILALAPVFAIAQATDDGPAADKPAPASTDGTGPAGVAEPAPAPGDAASEAGAADDELEKMLQGLSNEELDQLIESAVRSRLEVERKQVAEEMKEDLLLDPMEIKKAVKILEDKPLNTQQDNIERIIRALAVVDWRFGKAVKLLGESKAAESAKTVEKDLNVQEATYRSAARYTVYARALAAEGKGQEAVDAYGKIMGVMGDRISFAAAAAIESAKLYEKMDRFSYAAQMYGFAVENYGLTLDKKVLAMIKDKADDYAKFSGDPLGWAGREMGEVGKSLSKGDSGTKTQAKQEKIVAVLTDMIKTAEENQPGGGGGGKGDPRKRNKKPGEGEGEGEGEGGGMAQGRRPNGTNPSATGAQVSALVGGEVKRPDAKSETRNTGESGDWSTLPPRDLQKIRSIGSRVMSDRYRELISKYRTKVAEQK